MQNWTKCANQRKKQAVLKGNCCIETESEIQSSYLQPVNTKLTLYFSFLLKVNNLIRIYSCQLITGDILTSSGLGYAIQEFTKNKNES